MVLRIEDRIAIKEALFEILTKVKSLADFQKSWEAKREQLHQIDSIYSNEEANAEINSILDEYLKAREQAEFINSNGGLDYLKHKDGADGSGYFGHAGRPNQVGGSLPTNTVTLSMVDDFLAGFGVRKGDVVKKFGLRKDVLLTHIQNALEQGENWRGVFKSEEDYKKACELRDQMIADGVPADDKNLVKVSRATARYEFVMGAVNKIKEAGGVVEAKLKQSGKTEEEIDALLGKNVPEAESGIQAKPEPEPVKEPEAKPQPKKALELSGTNLEKAKQIINHFSKDAGGNAHAFKETGSVVKKQEVNRLGQDTISIMIKDLKEKADITNDLQKLFPNGLLNSIPSYKYNDIKKVADEFTGKKMDALKDVFNDACDDMLNRLGLIQHDGLRRLLYMQLSNLDAFRNDFLSYREKRYRNGSQFNKWYYVDIKYSKAEQLGHMESILSTVGMVKELDAYLQRKDSNYKGLSFFTSNKATVTLDDIMNNEHVKALLENLPENTKLLGEFMKAYLKGKGAFNPILDAYSWAGTERDVSDLFLNGLKYEGSISERDIKSAGDEYVSSDLKFLVNKLGTIALLDKYKTGFSFDDVADVSLDADLMEQTLNERLKVIRRDVNKNNLKYQLGEEDSIKPFLEMLHEDYGDDNDFINEHFSSKILDKINLTSDELKQAFEDYEFYGKAIFDKRTIADIKKASASGDLDALAKGYGRLLCQFDVGRFIKARAKPITVENEVKTAFSKKADDISRNTSFLEGGMVNNFGSGRSLATVEDIKKNTRMDLNNDSNYELFTKHLKGTDEILLTNFENQLTCSPDNFLDVITHPDDVGYQLHEQLDYNHHSEYNFKGMGSENRMSVFKVFDSLGDLDFDAEAGKFLNACIKDSYHFRGEDTPENIKKTFKTMVMNGSSWVGLPSLIALKKYVGDIKADKPKLDNALAEVKASLNSAGIKDDKLAEAIVSQGYCSYKYGILRQSSEYAEGKGPNGIGDDKYKPMPFFDLYDGVNLKGDLKSEHKWARDNAYAQVCYDAFKKSGFDLAHDTADNGMLAVKKSDIYADTSRISGYSDVSNSIINTSGKLHVNKDGFAKSLKTASANLKSIFPTFDDKEGIITGQQLSPTSRPKDRAKYGKTINQIEFWLDAVRGCLDKDGNEVKNYTWTAEDNQYLESAMTVGGGNYNDIKESNKFGAQSFLNIKTALSPNTDVPLYRFENMVNKYRNYDLKVGDTVDFDSQHFTWNEDFSMNCASEYFGEEQPVLFKMTGVKPFNNLEQHVGKGYNHRTGKLEPKGLVEYEGLIAGRTKIVNVSTVTLPNGKTCPCYEVEYDFDSRDTFVNLQAKEYAEKQGFYK